VRFFPSQDEREVPVQRQERPEIGEESLPLEMHTHMSNQQFTSNYRQAAPGDMVQSVLDLALTRIRHSHPSLRNSSLTSASIRVTSKSPDPRPRPSRPTRPSALLRRAAPHRQLARVLRRTDRRPETGRRPPTLPAHGGTPRHAHGERPQVSQSHSVPTARRQLPRKCSKSCPRSPATPSSSLRKSAPSAKTNSAMKRNWNRVPN